ncbi:AvrD family protein [Cellulomonas hominis]|uniref:AvrD family protein n=1 Tax=Cellulomonas hominis TaxID=156981 RepID=UPI001B97E008|nr:AvrD family protein [Cellulomonas hominis]VTR76002.1 hypothetical protein CHMI_00758 [Cellulomonas hominis]
MGAWVDGQTIDAHLGPASTRFFGEGFQKVRHRLSATEVVVTPDGRLQVSSRGALMYPQDWSVKATSSLAPHLSTIDAFVMAVEASELLLMRLYALSPLGRSQAWVRSADFRAGAAPQEDLGDFPVSATVASTQPNNGPLALGFVSDLDCRIGSVKVRLRIEHDVLGVRHEAGVIGDADDVLGENAGRFYGAGYTARSHLIDDVRRDDASTVSARVRIDGWDGDGSMRDDLGGAYRPAVSMLDAMTAHPQIAQALLYDLDGFDRSESNTLWMRKAAVAASTPHRAIDAPFTMVATIARTRLTPIGDATFRTSDFVGSFQGLACSYSLAHQLPARVADELSLTASQKG